MVQNTKFRPGRGTNKRIGGKRFTNPRVPDTEGGYWGLKGSNGTDTKDNTPATVSQGAIAHQYKVNITHNELEHQSKGSQRSRKWNCQEAITQGGAKSVEGRKRTRRRKRKETH